MRAPYTVICSVTHWLSLVNSTLIVQTDNIKSNYNFVRRELRKGCDCCPIATTIETLIASDHGITSLNRMEQSNDGARKGLLESLKGRERLGEPDTWRGSGLTTGRGSAGVRSEDLVDQV